MNDNLVLISGKSATGKSASLEGLKNPGGVVYLNCENNKKLPFQSKFGYSLNITHPSTIYEAFQQAETEIEDSHTIIVDTLTYLMDMYETQCVLTSSNTMQAWGEYAQYFKRLMQNYVATSSKNILFLAHTSDVYNESELAQETLVKVKGSLMNQGIESYFSTVISSKKMTLKNLKKYENDLLTITSDDEEVGFKYVFQTKLTKETVNERIRSPIGMWSTEETFIDNNAQLVIDRLHNYYN